MDIFAENKCWGNLLCNLRKNIHFLNESMKCLLIKTSLDDTVKRAISVWVSTFLPDIQYANISDTVLACVWVYVRHCGNVGSTEQKTSSFRLMTGQKEESRVPFVYKSPRMKIVVIWVRTPVYRTLRVDLYYTAAKQMTTLN